MALPEDRRVLTQEEAQQLVKFYVDNLWWKYQKSIPRYYDKEDVVLDIILKIFKKNPNPDYDPNWKPGEVVHRKRASGKDYKDVDTAYMLEPGYNPENPYDYLYHTVNNPTISIIDKYDGRTTSKKYYIQRIVDTQFIDMTRKKDALKYADSLDAPAYSDSDSHATKGDLVADDDAEKEVTRNLEQEDLNNAINKILNDLPLTPLSPRIVGCSPLTGEEDSEGNPIDTPLTARDIGLYILNGYTQEDVARIYHDSQTGKNVSVSTISKKWKEALELLKKAFSQSEELKDLGALDGYM